MEDLYIPNINGPEQFSEIMSAASGVFEGFKIKGHPPEGVGPLFYKLYARLQRSAFLQFEAGCFDDLAKDLQDGPEIGSFASRVRDEKIAYIEACRREQEILEDQANTVRRMGLADWIRYTGAYSRNLEGVRWKEHKDHVAVRLVDVPVETRLYFGSEPDCPKLAFGALEGSSEAHAQVREKIRQLADWMLDGGDPAFADFSGGQKEVIRLAR